MTSNEKKKQIAEIRRMICTMFEEYANDSVVVITDKINIALVNIYGLTLDYLDKSKQLRGVYQTLSYHHSIYRKGQSRKEWFITICEDCKKGDY